MIEKVRQIQTLPSYIVDVTTAEGVAVYAATNPPPTKDTVLGGWVYQKLPADPAGKFTYYFKAHEALSPIKIRDLRRFYIVCTMQTADQYVDVPFLLSYTLPLGDGQDAASWYRTRVSYSIKNTDYVYNGLKVMFWAGPAHEEPSDFPNLKKIRLTDRIVDGPDGHDETLNYLVAHSDSGTDVDYRTTTHNLGWETNDVKVMWELD